MSTIYPTQPPWPPQSQYGGDSQPLRVFSIGSAFSEGWRSMTANYGLFLAGTVTVFAIQIIFSLVVSVLDQVAAPLGSVVNLANSILVSPPLTAGIIYMGVRAFRREQVEYGDLFAGFSRYGTIIVINILLMLIIVGCMLPIFIGAIAVALLAGSNAAIIPLIVGGLISLVLVIVFAIRLSFASVAAIDPANGGVGIIESMKLSWDATGPEFGSLFGFYILLGLTMFGTMLMLCVGLVFLGYPLMMGALGAAYCMIFASRHAQLPADSYTETGIGPGHNQFGMAPS